ncbi:mitochondrial dicarboxylate carrier isoform X2 [Drosophila navojoa]|uniref:mitochondrial dicarboxylate carrier isoform X2 n=1 Tax=Drosophila navojoa TaxID=7232 RepID=UPI00084777B0|nr:mitochondrial dicarboxylate carrier isoform X2 [Drosophila navojoa]
MQTQKKKKSMLKTTVKVIRLRGFLGFYDGFTAAALRQLTCSSLRFSLYENGKHLEILQNSNSIFDKIYIASFAGIVGSLVGLPMDVINVRMQNDMKYAGNLRRNYKSVMDALIRIPKEEGWMTLYSGGIAAVLKAAIGNSAQLAVYDQPFDVLKTLMMNAPPTQFPTVFHAIKYMMRFGYLGPYRGLVPTIARKAPATISLFIIYEQLRLNLGYIPLDSK